MVSQCYLNYAKLRDKKHMTDYAVGKRANINRAAMTAWRRGTTTPSLRSLEKLAAFFKVDVDYFYEGM